MRTSITVMTLKPHLLVVACSLLASACFNDRGPEAGGSTGGTGSTADTVVTGDPADPSITQLCSESFARRGAIASAQCQCQVDQGKFTDVSMCLAATGNATTLEACTCEIYGGSPESRAGLECSAPAQQAVIECIMGLSCAQSISAFDVCIDTYFTGISTCAAPPREVASQVAIQCDMVAPLTCGSGETVPETWKCDKKSDCTDGSDEMGCAGIFACADGKGSIEEALKCDSFKDCMDGSDEMNCPTFMCTSSGNVIPLHFRCDGFSDCCAEIMPDCPDQSDEQNCPMFMCTSGMTIPIGFQCDGVMDCDDNSDEKDCMSDSTGM